MKLLHEASPIVNQPQLQLVCENLFILKVDKSKKMNLQEIVGLFWKKNEGYLLSLPTEGLRHSAGMLRDRLKLIFSCSHPSFLVQNFVPSYFLYSLFGFTIFNIDIFPIFVRSGLIYLRPDAPHMLRTLDHFSTFCRVD